MYTSHVYVCIYIHVYIYILLAGSLPTPVFLYHVCLCLCESVYQFIFLSATNVFLTGLLAWQKFASWYKSTCFTGTKVQILTQKALFPCLP